MEIVCQSIHQLPEVTRKIVEFGKDFRIWLLKGEMGAGKTTFAISLINLLGTVDRVSSPSYSLVNEYMLRNGELVFHFDFFRIKSVAEIFDIGFEEYIDKGNFCLIEWPELIEPYLPDKHLVICIQHPEKEKRIFKIVKNE